MFHTIECVCGVFMERCVLLRMYAAVVQLSCPGNLHGHVCMRICVCTYYVLHKCVYDSMSVHESVEIVYPQARMRSRLVVLAAALCWEHGCAENKIVQRLFVERSYLQGQYNSY